MSYTTLISADELAAALNDPALVVIDCRFDLTDPSWGERTYREGHIPGAVYANLDRDLSGPRTGANGRHPLPDPDTLARTFGRWGVSSRAQVVAYDQDAGMYASRLWWELRWLGHDAVAVLDGGWATWVREGRPVGVGVEGRAEETFVPRPRGELVATVEEVERLHHARGWRLLDARAPDRFRGENETIDPVAGHIPGAANHFFRTNLTEDGAFKSADDLRTQLRAVVGAVPPERTICYCGSGVTACHNLLAMEHAGLSGAKLYVGSWSEWSADAARPIEREGG
ncbi:MAG: sulfurtransferase [Luteitalea sp.]|nr:sulfurtransferase [Luteitalea sp.]